MFRFILPLVLFCFVTTAQAATLYHYPEKPETQHPTADQIASGAQPLLYDQFTAIYRYPSLYLDGAGNLDESSQDVFEEIKSQLAELDSQESIITVIGHSQKNYKGIEDVQLPTAFTNFWQRLGETIPPEQDDTDETVTNNMEAVKQLLLDNGATEEQIYLENRHGFDNAFAESERDGQELNQRTDVAIYLVKEKDSDGDGVLDSADLCPGTSRGIIVDARGCGKTYTLHLEFAFDSNKLRDPESSETIKQLETLDKFADTLRKHEEYRAVIIGYTDSTGDESYNQRLSLRRAEAVKKLLVKAGISEYRIGIDGLGEKYPIAPNDTKEGRQKNRRIELQLLAE